MTYSACFHQTISLAHPAEFGFAETFECNDCNRMGSRAFLDADGQANADRFDPEIHISMDDIAQRWPEDGMDPDVEDCLLAMLAHR